MNNAETPSTSRPILWFGGAFLLVASLFHFFGVTDVGYRPEYATRSIFMWLYGRWAEERGGDFSHGWMIPVVSLWLLWQDRRLIRSASRSPVSWGWAIMAVAILLHFAGLRAQQTRASFAALILMIWALPAYCLGWRAARYFAFPAVYLLLCLPWNFVDSASFPLRFMASVSADVILNGLALPTDRIGTALVLHPASGTFSLDVAEPCSGLRSLLAITALAAAYAYVVHRRTWKRILLFVSAVPVAIAGNIARILSIAMVAYSSGSEKAMKFYHDWSGYVVFLVAVVLLMAISRALKENPAAAADGGGSGQESESPAPDADLPRAPVIVSCVLLVCAQVCAALILQHPPQLGKPAAVDLPADIDAWKGGKSLYCQNERCLASFMEDALAGAVKCPSCGGKLDPWALAERQFLPEDTILNRRIYRNDKAWVWVGQVISGLQKSSLHRPEYCLRGQGYDIVGSRAVDIALSADKTMKVRVLRLARYGSDAYGRRTSESSACAYWYSDGILTTSSHIERMLRDASERVLRNRVPRWTYFTVSLPCRPDFGDDETKIGDFLRAWNPQ